MPFHFYLEPVMDQPNVAALFYGPVLLAAQEDGERTDWRKVKLDAEDIGNSVTGDPSTPPVSDRWRRFQALFRIV